jgi:hypothetical protein
MSQIFINSLTLESLFSINGLSPATGYRYIKTIDDILSPLNIDLWRYEKGMGSLNELELEVFKIFLTLVQKHTIKFAKKQLIKELQNNGYTIETNQQNRQSNRQSNNTRNQNDAQSNPAKPPNFYDSLLGI